jgi:signal transduction histidine kinase
MNLTRKAIILFVLAHTLLFVAGQVYTQKREKTHLRNLYASKAQLTTQLIGSNISALRCKGKSSQVKAALETLRKQQDIEFARLTIGAEVVTSVDPAFPVNLSLLDNFEHMGVLEELHIFVTFGEVPACAANEPAGEVVVGYSFRELNTALKRQFVSQINLFILQLAVMVGLILILSRVFRGFSSRIIERCRGIARGDLRDVQLFDKSNEFSPVSESLNALCASVVRVKKERDREKVQLVSKAKFLAVEEVAASIARQLKNPISIIKGKAGQFRKILGFPEIDRTILLRQSESILEQTEKLLRLSEKLEVFSSSARSQFQSIRVKSLLDEVLLFADARFQLLKVVVQVELEDPALRIECRPQDVVQILNTLVENSLDAVADQDEKWIKIQVSESAEMVEFAVADNGPGIAVQVRENIMSPFFSTKTKNKVPGLGMGLSHALAIARQHQGSLGLEADSPHTRFVLRLPQVQSGFLDLEGTSSVAKKNKKAA